MPLVVESASPAGRYSAVFEDDGETGYFYGLDADAAEPIVDALHVYDAEAAAFPQSAAFEIRWSADGNVVALVIDEQLHAIFDFARRRACCRTGFPPATGRFTASHDWDDALAGLFR